jgi:hypothetical protein
MASANGVAVKNAIFLLNITLLTYGSFVLLHPAQYEPLLPDSARRPALGMCMSSWIRKKCLFFIVSLFLDAGISLGLKILSCVGIVNSGKPN